MKKTHIGIIPTLAAIALIFAGCAGTIPPLPAGEPNALILDQYNATGSATKKVIIPTATNSVLVTGTGVAPGFAPRAEFASATALTSATASLTTLVNSATTSLAAAINTKQNASPALSKITESGGLPLWNGSAWPGGGGDSNWVHATGDIPAPGNYYITGARAVLLPSTAPAGAIITAYFHGDSDFASMKCYGMRQYEGAVSGTVEIHGGQYAVFIFINNSWYIAHTSGDFLY